MTGRLLLDNSAWSRLRGEDLPDASGDAMIAAFSERRITVCLPFLLEVGYSARSGREHAALLHELLGLPRISIDECGEARALEAQSQLALTGHHRVPPADVLLAALADRHALDVLHYDGHFDTIAEHTNLRFDSVWLAPRGSL